MIAAQEPVPQGEPGSELEVYVMTMGPGDLIWERYGHNGLGVRDLRTGDNLVYNWGTFSFNEPDFLLRFLSGRNHYWVQAEDASRSLSVYQQLNRSVWIQVLNLTPAQRLEVKRLVEDNVREENRYYQYDYFGDNCSTRVRDVIDRVLGGRLAEEFATGSGLTFRDEARRLSDPDHLAFAGIDFALGTPSDREMSVYESMYVPMRLRDALRTATLPTTGGATATPLVLHEVQLFQATRAPERDHPRSQWLMFLVAGALLGGVVWVALRSDRVGLRRFVATPWLVVTGLFGTVLIIMWTLTEHRWMYRNVNLLLFNPLWLAMIPVIWTAKPRWSTWGRHVGQALLVLLGVALILGVIGRPQQSGNFVLLAAPAHLAILAFVLRRRQA
jgi:hypothetical protein